jgi:UDP-N-acetylmuramoyl-L-alanyl-D-glutamate--2,6-diaminopimelate ligase
MITFFKKITPSWLFDLYHRFFPWLGSFVYGRPSEKIGVIGITGTNGKTTAVHALSDILELAGFKVASISSLRFKMGSKEHPNTLKMTMPGRMKLQRFLDQAVKAKCHYAVIEVTSEGIKQHRHEHVRFLGAVMTNITPEHIESHGSFEAYKKAKLKLFEAVQSNPDPEKFGVFNLDDPLHRYFMAKGILRRFGYTLADSKEKGVKVFRAQVMAKSNVPLKFRLDRAVYKTKVQGQYNISNIMAALSAAKALGVGVKIIKAAVQGFDMPAGRLEFIIKKPFLVVVDYAHTPDALEKVYETIFPTAKRLICVLSATGGGRDRWKRPKLGGVASKFCKKIIITNEDPYDEDPWQIIHEVAGGIKAEKILDRQLAIKRALTLARKGDAVIITGKGAEPWMVVERGKKIPWDDREKVKEALVKLRIKGKK